MKCPKCGYLGFEPVDRCRNCGYEFSLMAPAAAAPELPLRTDAQSAQPLDDLTLIDAAAAPSPAVALTDIGPNLGLAGAASRPEPQSPAARVAAQPAPTSDELPLFGPPIPDDEPLITRASPPRPPLAVRRATPDAARQRTGQPRPQPLDLDLGAEPGAQKWPHPVTPDRSSLDRFPSDRVPADRGRPAGQREAFAAPVEDAPVGTRFVAFAIDLVILAAIDAAVVYFTMKICGLTWGEAGVLPKGPLLAFLLVQNGGYLVAFTAGGQTLGKMATGIRVVDTDSDAATVDLGRAITRSVVWVLLAAPAGLGFLTLLSRDHRGLHDRFARTRVVRASA